VVIVFPLAIAKAGGFSAMVNNAPPGFFAPVNEQYNWVYIFLLTGLYCVAYSSTNWHLIQKYFCVATERDAKKVGWMVVVLNIVGPPLILVPAIAARQFMPDMDYLLAHDKEIYPRLCIVLLPVGMLGLIIAAMFSATMANLSSHFNVRASVLTNDVYRRLMRPHATEKELVVAGRAMTALVGGLTILLAYHLAQASAPALFKIMVTVFGAAVAPLGIPMLLGLVSRRISNLSATTALIAGLAVSIGLVLGLPKEGFEWLGIHWEREVVVFAISTLTVLALMYGLSAIWPMGAAERERVAAFHRRMDAPIGELPEDRSPTESSDGAVSPFRIVGVCVVCIGVLMLCVQPFIDEWLPRVLNVILGLTLVAIGWSMTWLSKRARRNAGTVTGPNR
jgi:solute:Na+ symporter, SSS family